MHHMTIHTQARIARLLAEYLEPAVYRARHSLTVTAWQVPDEPVPFAQAKRATYSPFTIGLPWGKPWGTVWFHLTGEVPDHWIGVPESRVELVIDLGFTQASPGFQAEGTAWSPDGRIIKAVEPRNRYVPIDPKLPINVYLEAAANPDISGGVWTRPTPLGDKATAGQDPLYRLVSVDVALRDDTVAELIADVRTLVGLAEILPVTSPRAAEIWYALDDMMDAIDPVDVAASAAAARKILAAPLARPALGSAHRIHAVGHAHIDSAWLWPTRETIRKCARTFSNVLALMEEDPTVTFACSSAQQYAWVQEFYPELFERIRHRVAEGRFIPVGGMWVESDTNMVGGEALIRQFLEAKSFFRDEFGVEPTEVWLPDSFGYTGAFPQIARLAGCDHFLTQKISWNDTNTMPHHTFWWEGIDGSRVLTHFPPVDTYNAELTATELERAERQFADKGRANTSLVPFGYGDGGGGPTREMLAAAHRAHNLEGLPHVEMSTPRTFFAAARAEYHAPPTWTGEMYLEFHRGTYTSQARTKRGNRRSEHLLREAELWATTASVRFGAPYPMDALRRIWRIVLLQQFHDILPGSSIAWVHREAERHYREIASNLERIIHEALKVLLGQGDTPIAINASPIAHSDIPAMGATPASPQPVTTLTQRGASWVLTNDALSVTIDERGLVVSYIDRASGREVIIPGQAGNLLQIHRDIPNNWEAWDIDRHYRNTVTNLVEVDLIEPIPGTATLRVVRSFGSSRVEQHLELVEVPSPALRITTKVQWHERQKLLKLAFPVDVTATQAASEIQFGHIYRATHTNTSWDAARFETVAHRWVHIAEPGFGVGIANDSTYGHDITRFRYGRDEERHIGTMVRLSLVRAPLFPDPEADQGDHEFQCDVVVGAHLSDVMSHGYALNIPERQLLGKHGIEPLIRVTAQGLHPKAVIVEAVKLAHDGSGDVVVRLYESLGGRAHAKIAVDFPYQDVLPTDVLERPLPSMTVDTSSRGVHVDFTPFQIVTLRFKRTPPLEKLIEDDTISVGVADTDQQFLS